MRVPSEATPEKRDIVFDFISHNEEVVGSRFQLGIIARIGRRFALRKRHQNKHLDFDP